METSQYVLTYIYHSYCPDCASLKDWIIDLFRACSVHRGIESREWRFQMIAPPWDRSARRPLVPVEFAEIDVPGLMLKVDDRLIFATQSVRVIKELVARTSAALVRGQTNEQIAIHLETAIRELESSRDVTL